MKILIDTNVLLDYVLCREPFFKSSADVLHFCVDNGTERAMAAHSILNMWFILRKLMPEDDRRNTLIDLSKAISVIPVDYVKICNALIRKEFKDFEDCVQEECAVSFGADYIITRNVQDFTASRIPALTPEDFLNKCGGITS